MKRTNLKEEVNTFKLLSLKIHEDALVKNEEQTMRWKTYKDDHVSLSSHLMSFRDHLTHPIMVPIGTKALMKGSLVHTNEILVCLGDNWFTKQSVKEATELCQRRVKSSEEMLDRLNKERELLQSRMNFPLENDTFGNGEAQEIIEPYNEELETEWRARHRQKEQEYHKKLAELKTQQKTQIESEEDLWKRLDALDLQEELEDELDRLNEECEVESDSSEADSQTEDPDSNSDDNNKEVSKEKAQSDREVRRLEHRISFDKETDSSDVDNEIIRISFNHSDITSELSLCRDATPASIYTMFSECFNRAPKSILKKSKSHSANENEVRNRTNMAEEMNKPTDEWKISTTPVTALGDVVERTQPIIQEEEKNRPVSKFKASRLAARM